MLIIVEADLQWFFFYKSRMFLYTADAYACDITHSPNTAQDKLGKKRGHWRYDGSMGQTDKNAKWIGACGKQKPNPGQFEILEENGSLAATLISLCIFSKLERAYLYL